MAPPSGPPPDLAGLFLTHGHFGHVSGLLWLGDEAMAARGVPVYAPPGLVAFLGANEPWRTLIDRGHLAPRPLQDGIPIALENGLAVKPFHVPHRAAFGETYGFVVAGPNRSIAYLPDIDAWDDWSGGHGLEDLLSRVDTAYLDGTFFSADELADRPMSEVPHPTIEETLGRLAAMGGAVSAKVRFLHLNHTNPALRAGTAAQDRVAAAGANVAQEGETWAL